MKCPTCGGSLVSTKRDGIEVDCCQSCQGLWLSRQDLEQLENEAYDLGKKGTLIFHSEASDLDCPECGSKLQNFEYRDYDLQLGYCPDGHGFWLDAGEDKRVLELMRREEKALKRKLNAEDQWSFDLKHWRSPDIIDKIITAVRGGREFS